MWMFLSDLGDDTACHTNVWPCDNCLSNFVCSMPRCQQRPRQSQDVGSLYCKALRVLKSTGTTDNADIFEEGGIARILVTLASSHYPHDCTVADWLLRGAGSSLVSPTAVCFSVIVLEGCSAFIVFLLAFLGGLSATRRSNFSSCRPLPRVSSCNYCVFDSAILLICFCV